MQIKNLQNTTDATTLRDDNAGSMEIHCNPALITYRNTNIYKYRKYKQKRRLQLLPGDYKEKKKVDPVTTPQSKPRGAPYYVKNNPSKKKEGMFENVDNGFSFPIG